MTLPAEVPQHEVVSLAARKSAYAVAIPVINEGNRILTQLQRMKDVAGVPDVIIADGGSTDGSMEPTRLASLGVRARLTKQGPGRLGAQIRMAFGYALSEGYDGVILIDGNNKDDPSAIPQFSRALADGFDFVQGSRFVKGARAIHNPLQRLLGIRLVHAPLISLAARHHYTDTTNGFRGYSRRFLTDPRVAPLREVFSGYELHYFLSIRAGQLGFRVTELPVTREYPRHGPVPTKISPLRGNVAVLRALAASCLGRFDP